MEPLGTYVIRVYRQDAAGMTGMVESVQSGEQQPFHRPEELWRALQHLASSRRGPIHPSEEKTP